MNSRIKQCQIEIGLGEIGFQPQYELEMFDRLVRPACFCQRQSQIVVSFDIIWFQTQCGTVMLDPFPNPAYLY